VNIDRMAGTVKSHGAGHIAQGRVGTGGNGAKSKDLKTVGRNRFL
jgi:hypothetical protein